MQTNKVIIVEGFEMVGKTSYAKTLAERTNNFIYHADHDLTDKTVGRNNSWTIGYGIFDLLSHIPTEETIIIDRHVASSYVYQKLYGPEGELYSEVIDYYKNNKFFHDSVTHIHVQHESKEEALKIFEKSKTRDKNSNELSNKYDQFDNFEEYWSRYSKAQEYFLEAYLKLGVAPRVVNTYYGGWRVESS